MGNTLLKAIEKEQWGEVKGIIADERNHALVRTTTYPIRRQTVPNEVTEEQVYILHLLLWKAAPIDVVQLVLQIDPTQLIKKSRPSEEYAVHFAAMNPSPGLNMDALEMILEQNQEGLMKKSSRGQTPLHIACEILQPIWFIKKLVSKEPSSIEIRDSNGQTPWDILQIKSGSLLYYNNRLKDVLGPSVVSTTPVTAAAGGGDKGTMTLLLGGGGDGSGTSTPTRTKQQQQRIPFSIETESSCRNSVVSDASGGTCPMSSSSSPICVLCKENIAGWAIIPCGHLCLCEECAVDYSPSRGCPICEEPYDLCIQIITHAIPLSSSRSENQKPQPQQPRHQQHHHQHHEIQ